MNELFINAGSKLRELRKFKGYTLKEVGEKLHLSGQAVGNYEHNRRTLSFTLAIKFAKLYGVPVSQLCSKDLSIIPEDKLLNVFKENAKLENDFDVVVSGAISNRAYEELMSFVDYLKQKYR